MAVGQIAGSLMVETVTVITNTGIATANGEWGDYVEGGWFGRAQPGQLQCFLACSLTAGVHSRCQDNGLLPQSSRPVRGGCPITYLLGDEGGNGGETTWVISGDMNGRDGTSGDDSLGLGPASMMVYSSVVTTSTRSCSHIHSMAKASCSSIFLAVLECLVITRRLRWSNLPKLEMQPTNSTGSASKLRGSSNDFVIVGGGIGSAADNKALASSTSAVVDGFFEMSLGMGEDQVYVNDTSTGLRWIFREQTGSEVDAYVSGEDEARRRMSTPTLVKTVAKSTWTVRARAAL